MRLLRLLSVVGRASRTEFIVVSLVLGALAYGGYYGLALAAAAGAPLDWIAWTSTAFYLACGWTLVALLNRRAHDLDQSFGVVLAYVMGALLLATLGGL